MARLTGSPLHLGRPVMVTGFAPGIASSRLDRQVAFHKRAAILQYDEGLLRAEASRLARHQIDELRVTMVQQGTEDAARPAGGLYLRQHSGARDRAPCRGRRGMGFKSPVR